MCSLQLLEEHSATVEVLDSTKLLLQDTSEKLDTTEKALDRSQAKLKRTMQERDEQTHLVQSHVTNEGKLQCEAHNVSGL